MASNPAVRRAKAADPEPRARSGTQSIQRALSVLRILATAREAGFGLTEIARQAGLSGPTVHRILNILVTEGIVEQKPRTRRYAVGEQIPLLALARPASSPLLAAALPHLNAAVEAIGDTGYLTLRTGLDTICVARRLGDYPIQVLPLDVGDRRPLGVSSAGFAMLASLDPQQARSIVMQNRRRFSSYAISVEEALLSVSRARAHGYAFRERGLVPGTRALSITIGEAGSEAVAALSIAAIARRLPHPRVLVIVDRLREHAAQIELALRPSSAPSRARS